MLCSCLCYRVNVSVADMHAATVQMRLLFSKVVYFYLANAFHVESLFTGRHRNEVYCQSATAVKCAGIHIRLVGA